VAQQQAVSNKTSKLQLVRRATLPKNPVAFTAAQQSVINHRGSPLLVTGPAGSGKSTTLIAAISARINEGCDPNTILAITYGRESASKLRDLIATSNPSSHTVNEPIARTFHSIAFLILNDHSLNDSDLNENVGSEKQYILLSGAEQDAEITQLLLADAKLEKENPGSTDWPSELLAALTTRGFAKELRDFIGRATERGSSPEELVKYADKYGQKYWPAICKFWHRYQGAVALRNATTTYSLNRIDPSEIIIAAGIKLENNLKLQQKYQKLFPVIYVDEFQESDRGQRKLLELLSGPELIIFADPQSAVGRFRGADPENLLSDIEKLGITNQIKLGQSFRQIKKTSVAKLSSATEEANYIAHQFRSAHLKEGLAWSQMVVILRSPGSQVSALQRAFAINNVPVEIDALALSLADNPAIKPILTLAQIALKQISLIPANWEIIEELLHSEFAGADAISIRQMRIALSKAEKINKSSDAKTSTELILDALTAPTISIDWDQAAPLKRLNDLISLAVKSLRSKGDISDLLWAIWSNGKNYEGQLISKSWQASALNGGVTGAIADNNLDAVIQLFEVARRFSERMPGAAPQLFITQLLGEKILSDSITATAQRNEVVKVLTVHSAKGQEWQFVALAGMQEGVWPNLKQRGSLLGSERLVEIFRHGISNPQALDAISASGLMEDEDRLLNVASTRSTNQLLITAVQQEDNEPSRYFTKFAGEEIEFTKPQRSITQPALIAELRSILINANDEKEKEFAARALKTLAENGASAADPRNWLGTLETSDDTPVIKSDEQLRVSPSYLESFDECGVKWMLERSGGRDSDSTAQVLGSAIHVLAAQFKDNPQLSVDDLQDRLKGAWSLIDMNKGWIKDYEYRRASTMLHKFFTWQLARGNKLVDVERRFEFELGGAKVTGSIDRLELTSENKFYIVDLKTGQSAVSAEDAKTNKQLQVYQLAVVENGVDPKLDSNQVSGAELLFVGDQKVKSASVRAQSEIDADQVRAELLNSAQGMSAAIFTAKINDRCRTCSLKSSCPIQPQGRRVIE
jgi:superfamily I DNA/RNA helicase/RecB family exonuclease